jgi:hypothetical protein
VENLRICISNNFTENAYAAGMKIMSFINFLLGYIHYTGRGIHNDISY